MVVILVGFMIGGCLITDFFGISIPGLRIAGGLVVAGIGSRLLMAPPRDPARNDAPYAEARAKPDIAFSPLAMPMMGGPGSIAVKIGFTSLSTGWFDYVAIILGILIVAAITYDTLRLSERFVGVLGLNG